MGWIYFHFGNQFASLFGAATVDEYCGRGIYRVLVAQRLKNARQQGRRFVTTGASPYSRPILSEMGFNLLTIETDYVWKGRYVPTK